MKKQLIASAFLLVFCSNLTYAFSCREDVDQMYIQIKKYESIRSTDGHYLTDIASLPDQEKSTCFAYGYKPGQINPEYVCKVKWEKGNWGSTLSCV